MKNIFVLVFFVCCSYVSVAQCDKKVKFTSSKTEYLDSAGNVQDTRIENTTIELSKEEIVVRPGNVEDREMRGKLTNWVCAWKTAYKEGKTSFTSSLMTNNGETNEVSIVIEGKDGKMTLTAVPKERPDRKIRVPIDNYEEK